MVFAFVGLLVNAGILALLYVFHVQINLVEIGITTISVGCAIALFKYRSPLIGLFDQSRRQRQSYLQRLYSFIDSIHAVFSLKEQGSELLELLLRSINVNQACLMFPEAGSEDYSAQFTEPLGDKAELASFRLQANALIIGYLKREHTMLLRDDLETNPAFLGMWAQEREEIQGRDISMFMPLISRDQLIAILVLGTKVSGRFTLEDFNIINDVTNRVAVSMEKEFLREQLREREEELSVINNSSVILASSLDIKEIFGAFIEELKKVVDVTWASIVLEEDGELCCAALSSPEHSDYKIGDSIPMESSGVGWVITNRKLFLEPDLQKDSSFQTGESHLRYGLRTLVYLPLLAKGRIIGCFMVASASPNAYSHRHVKLLEQLASQISMPLENSQLYARAEKKARVDALTGLLNRRSFDEILNNEEARSSDYGEQFSVILLDLDNFKSYNDAFGHPAGDQLLRWIGSMLKSNIKRSDYAFRFGGDEFAILLPRAETVAAITVAERIRSKIEKDQTRSSVKITSSLGAATYPLLASNPIDIFQAADQALYEAKRRGRNRVYIFGSTN